MARIRPNNEVAQRVLEHLPPGYSPRWGYFGSGHYCLAVRVSDVGQAFTLGAAMATKCPDLGEIGFEQIGAEKLVVFKSPKVYLGAD